MVRGLPTHLMEDDILHIFGEKYGAVVGIELPMKELDGAREHEKVTKAANEREADFKRAQMVVRESLAVDEDYQQFLADKLGPEASGRIGTPERATAETL